MKKRLWNALRIVVVVVFAALMAMPSHLPTLAGKDAIEEEKKKQQELEAELKDTNKFLDKLKDQCSSTQDYIIQIDKQLTSLENNIYDIKQNITFKEAEIAITKGLLLAANADIDAQYEAMKLRIKYMYENDNFEFGHLLFTSSNISDFLSQAEYISKITKYDRELLDEMKATKAEIETLEAKLESELYNLNERLAEVEAEQKAVDTLLANKKNELSEFENEAEAQKKQAEILAQRIKAQAQLIKELEEIERKREEEAAKNNLNLTYDGGRLQWPIPGYTRISSDYGYRVDPITGKKDSVHNGIDMPAPKGTKVVAAYKGEVAWAYYSSSAGNWVGIDHGNGLYTVYMHFSKTLVKQGDKVETGQVIGLVGTTGWSTGNHLHFEVRLNKSYVSPWKYLLKP